MKSNTLPIFTTLACGLAFLSALHAGPSAADVGDAETFGRDVLYMGAVSMFVTLSPDCSAEPSPAPSPGQCFDLAPAPSVTTFAANELCSIKLPKNATKDVIYPALNFFVNYQLQNSTGTPQPQGLFIFQGSLTIASDALNDPSIIDPATGMPANGKLTFQFTYNYRDDRSMAVDDRQRLRITLVRVGNTGITKAQLVGEGLSQSVVDNLFKSAITISMSITGTTKLCTDATITGNMRLFGD
jgi:hypothetical protein